MATIEGGAIARVDAHVYRLELAAILGELAGVGVTYVLTGSLAAQLWGVAESPRDIDLAPALDAANLERLAGVLEGWGARPIYNPGWKAAPDLAAIASWRPRPATAEQLDHLMATPLGLIDVVPRVSGTHESLAARATEVAAFGAVVRAAHPEDLRATLRPDRRPRHARRDGLLARARRPYFLMSQRLGWRTWERGDGVLAARLWGDREVTRFIEAAPLDDAGVAARMAVEIDRRAEHGFQYWPVFDRERAALVGCCGLRPGPEPEVPEIGVHLVTSERGRGYAREAMAAVIEHARSRLGARALFAGHHPDNHRSRRMLEALGFTRTGVERYEPTGLMHPTYRFSLRVE